MNPLDLLDRLVYRVALTLATLYDVAMKAIGR